MNQPFTPAYIAQIEIGEQILFTRNESIFIATITEVREKAVKVDYCWEGIWGGNLCTVFRYCTWLPKSVLINDETGGLTVKPWLKNKGIDKDKAYNIKPYYVLNGKKHFA